MPKLTTGEGLWGTNMNDLKRKKKNLSLKGAVIQLPFLILSIKCLMRHVELNVSENLLVNDKITASCRRNMCRKHYVKHYKQQK